MILVEPQNKYVYKSNVLPSPQKVNCSLFNHLLKSTVLRSVSLEVVIKTILLQSSSHPSVDSTDPLLLSQCSAFAAWGHASAWIPLLDDARRLLTALNREHFAVILDNEREFQLAVQWWASTLHSVEEDDHGILPVLPSLALAYSRVCNNRSKERIQRRIIDEILLAQGRIVIVNSGKLFPLAFRVDLNLAIRSEESYLVASAGNPDAEWRSPTSWWQYLQRPLQINYRINNFPFKGTPRFPTPPLVYWWRNIWLLNYWICRRIQKEW